MIIALLSDSHDRLEYLHKTTEILGRFSVAALVHAGDFISPFALKPLLELGIPIYGILGNNDGERIILSKLIENTGGKLFTYPQMVTVCHKNIWLQHEPSENLALLRQYPTKKKSSVSLRAENAQGLSKDADNMGDSEEKIPDLIVFGHTHKAVFFPKTPATLPLINPGELCGYLSGIPTFALYDTEKDAVEIIDVRQGSPITKEILQNKIV